MTKKIEVTLPEISKEVAEAIADVRKYYSDSEIIKTIAKDDGRTIYTTDVCTLIKFAKERDIDTVVKALYIGYNVEKTPEDKVREYYEELNKSARIGNNDWYAAAGVLHTLDFLGIIVEGVND